MLNQIKVKILTEQVNRLNNRIAKLQTKEDAYAAEVEQYHKKNNNTELDDISAKIVYHLLTKQERIALRINHLLDRVIHKQKQMKVLLESILATRNA